MKNWMNRALNTLARPAALLALLITVTGGLLACNNEPADGVLGGSETPSIDGVWLAVKDEYDIDYLEDEWYEEDGMHDTIERDTADVFARTFYVIRDGAIFGAYYESQDEWEEEGGAQSQFSRIQSVGNGRWVMGVDDTVKIERKGKNLVITQTYTYEKHLIEGTVKRTFTEYKGAFPPAEWFMDPAMAYEPDNTKSTAKAIGTEGDPQRRYLTAEDVDWFSFQAEKGKTYTLEIDSDEVEAIIRLYDKNGSTQLAFDDRYIDWECPSTGTYYFRVSNLDDYYEGYYEAYVYTYDDEAFSLAKTQALKKAREARPKHLRGVSMRKYPG